MSRSGEDENKAEDLQNSSRALRDIARLLNVPVADLLSTASRPVTTNATAPSYAALSELIRLYTALGIDQRSDVFAYIRQFSFKAD